MDLCNKLRNKENSNSIKELMDKLDNLCTQLSSSCDENTKKLIDSINDLGTKLTTDSNDKNTINIEGLEDLQTTIQKICDKLLEKNDKNSTELVKKLNELCKKLFSNNNENMINVKGLSVLQQTVKQISDKLPEKEDSNTTIEVLTDKQMKGYLKGIKTLFSDVLINNINEDLIQAVETSFVDEDIKSHLIHIKRETIEKYLDSLNITNLLTQKYLDTFKEDIKKLCNEDEFITIGDTKKNIKKKLIDKFDEDFKECSIKEKLPSNFEKYIDDNLIYLDNKSIKELINNLSIYDLLLNDIQKYLNDFKKNIKKLCNEDKFITVGYTKENIKKKLIDKFNEHFKECNIKEELSANFNGYVCQNWKKFDIDNKSIKKLIDDFNIQNLLITDYLKVVKEDIEKLCDNKNKTIKIKDEIKNKFSDNVKNDKNKSELVENFNHCVDDFFKHDYFMIQLEQIIAKMKESVQSKREPKTNKPIGFEVKISEDIGKLVGDCKAKIENKEDENKEDENKKLQNFYKNIEYKNENPNIELFWRLIDLKILLDQLSNNLKYEFSRYYFPSFDKKYKPFDILQGEADKREFDRETNFLMCQFLSDVNFESCEFENKVSFNLAEFCKDKEVKFNRARFEDEAYFRKTYFNGDTDFESCFFANATFDEVSFPKNNKIDKVDVKVFNNILTGITLGFFAILFISTYYFQQAMFLVDSIAVSIIIFFVLKLFFWIILYGIIKNNHKYLNNKCLLYSNEVVCEKFLEQNEDLWKKEKNLYKKFNTNYPKSKYIYEKNKNVRYIALLLGQDVFKKYRDKLPDSKDKDKLNKNQKKLLDIAELIKLKYLHNVILRYMTLSLYVILYFLCLKNGFVDNIIDLLNIGFLFDLIDWITLVLYIPFQLAKWFILIYGIYYVWNTYVRYQYYQNLLDNYSNKENFLIKTIHMVRVTMKELMWSDFTTAHDVQRIDTNRETLARLKEANNNKGNFIDANLFFAAESNAYIIKTWKKFVTFPTLADAKEDCNNKPPANIFGRLSLLPDLISFVFAKYTSNYGTSWVIPLIWVLLIVIGFSSTFEMNKDFKATQSTPKFLLVENKENQQTKHDYEMDVTILPNSNDKQKVFDLTKIEEETSIALETQVIDNKNNTDKRHFDYYNHEFDSDGRYVLDENRSMTVSVAYLANSAYSTFFAKEKWFETTTTDNKKFLLKIGTSILLLYLLGAFIFAIKNRTRRA